jgi:hypothetical protein
LAAATVALVAGLDADLAGRRIPARAAGSGG